MKDSGLGSQILRQNSDSSLHLTAVIRPCRLCQRAQATSPIELGGGSMEGGQERTMPLAHAAVGSAPAAGPAERCRARM